MVKFKRPPFRRYISGLCRGWALRKRSDAVITDAVIQAARRVLFGLQEGLTVETIDAWVADVYMLCEVAHTPGRPYFGGHWSRPEYGCAVNIKATLDGLDAPALLTFLDAEFHECMRVNHVPVQSEETA